MNQKVTLAVSAALMSMSVQAAAELGGAVQDRADAQEQVFFTAPPVSVNKNVSSDVSARKKRFEIEKDLAPGDYVYVVQLVNPSVALYDGGIEGYPATNPRVKATKLGERVKQSKLDLQSRDVQRYAQLIERKQQEVLTTARQTLGDVNVLKQYKYAINGFSVKMSQDEALRLSNVPGVLKVERDQIYQLNTDVGPTLVGAPNVWDGSATAGMGTLGEGVIVGIFDTGVNTDHPSFLDVGEDGYDHTNPRGEGNYVGDCAGEFPELCNDKLIGVRSYPSITDDYADDTVFPPGLPRNGEDYNGHGSHTASTAAGNVLVDTPLYVPDIGAEESDGTPTEVIFEHMSGVAPHANIISYGVCRQGNTGDTYVGCTGSAILGAQEDAIQDGIDVVNHSIGPGPGNNLAWTNASEVGFLSMRNAGIFVATSAGNDGPGPGTTSKQAPWYTAVAASTHGREIDTSKEMRDFSGGDTELDTLTGSSNSAGITASIVYAGDYTNPNDPDNDPAQCLQPFPAGTFSGEIVVCDRGSIARVQKAVNVADGGAGGYVLANLDGGATSVNSDFYVVPGIHIDSTQGDALKAWLASGEGHMGTITAADPAVTVNDAAADRVIGFSSRGPNLTISALSPWVAAPGVNIYAATNDQDFGKDVTTPAPSDFNFLSGTSMASPHVAGAAALLTALYPDWTPDQIRSALMMTSTTAMVNDDDDSAADWFDMGAGRIQVDVAAQTGLVMDETAQNYADANPNNGGDPKTLNIPSLTETSCLGTCSWTRTVTAVKAGTYAVAGASVAGDLAISATPATFDLEVGQSQEITVTVDASASPSNVWSFGLINITSDVSPDLHMPVSVVASNGNLPNSFEFEANRNQDSYLVMGLEALEITDVQLTAMATMSTTVEATVAQDSGRSEVIDDLADGTYILPLTVDDTAVRIVAEITETTSPDLDMWMYFDANGDGAPSEDELIDAGRTVTSLEKVDALLDAPGLYWVIVQNWQASEAGEDAFTMEYGVVTNAAQDMLTISAPTTQAALAPFDMRFTWDMPDAMTGDRMYAAFTMGTSADRPTNVGTFPVDIMRGPDDVMVVTEQLDRVENGDTVSFAVSVLPNYTTEDRDYEINVTLPDGVSLVDGSTDATVDGDTLSWTLTQESLLFAEPVYRVTSNATDATCAIPFGDGSYINLADFGVPLETSVDGDDVSAVFNARFQFLGTEYDSFTMNSNGFVSLDQSGDVGPNTWFNQLLPNAEIPNAVVAPMWRDMFTDVANGSGISVAWTGGQNLVIIEWDDMRTVYNGVEDLLDFEIAVNNDVQPGEPNIVFAYTNVTHTLADLIPTTIGYENFSGEAGVTTHFVPYFDEADAPIGNIGADAVDGAQICFWLEGASPDPTLLTFDVTVDEANLGGPIQLTAMSSVTNIEGTAAVASMVEASVQVEGAPIATIDGMTDAALSITETGELALPGQVVEPNGDDFDILWRQVSGPAAVIAGNGLAEAKLIAPEVEEDSTIELVMEATDELGNMSRATVTVTVMNNLAPTLTVTAPSEIGEGETITVTASGTDPEGDALTYTINGAPGSSFSMTAPGTDSSTTVSFVVTVTDDLNTVSETVTVTVNDRSGGSLGWIALLLIPVALLRRRMK